MTVELKRIRRKISLEMAEADRKGRLPEYMRDMHRRAERALEEARARVRSRRRKQA